MGLGEEEWERINDKEKIISVSSDNQRSARDNRVYSDSRFAVNPAVEDGKLGD